MRRSASVLASALALAAAHGAHAAAERDDGRSAYGQYLAGRAALNLGRGDAASVYFDRAAQAAPAHDFVRERAFTAALLSGDVARASALAPVEADAPAMSDLARLTRATEMLAAGKGRPAAAVLEGRPVAWPHARAAALLRPWLAAAAGDWASALATVDGDGDRGLALFAEQSRALMLERRGRHAEAESILKTLSADPAGALFRADHGAFLERRGRAVEAAAVYDAALQASPGDRAARIGRERVTRGSPPPPAPDLRQGASAALAAAALAVVAERQVETGLAYLRLAARLDPESDQVAMMLGEALGALGDAEGARAAWSRVPITSPYAVDARSRLAMSLIGSEPERALAIAQEMVATDAGDRRAVLTLSEVYRQTDRPADAYRVLAALDGDSDSETLFLRGVALEQAGRWAEAEPVLIRALELRPDDAEIQNYLGYAWIDRGTRVTEGMALVEKAVAANPNSGAMQDSLGWAHYRLGDIEKAIDLLELAVRLEPGDAEINDHLGDAYWVAGRRVEARFQWARVLTLDPTPKQKASAEAKLKSGLPQDRIAGR